MEVSMLYNILNIISYAITLILKIIANAAICFTIFFVGIYVMTLMPDAADNQYVVFQHVLLLAYLSALPVLKWDMEYINTKTTNCVIGAFLIISCIAIQLAFHSNLTVMSFYSVEAIFSYTAFFFLMRVLRKELYSASAYIMT